MINGKKSPPITSLINRLVFSFLLSLAGCLGMVFSRLNLEYLRRTVFEHPQAHFYADLISLTCFFLGLLMIFYYRSLIKPRLKRIVDMGLDR